MAFTDAGIFIVKGENGKLTKVAYSKTRDNHIAVGRSFYASRSAGLDAEGIYELIVDKDAFNNFCVAAVGNKLTVDQYWAYLDSLKKDAVRQADLKARRDRFEEIRKEEQHRLDAVYAARMNAVEGNERLNKKRQQLLRDLEEKRRIETDRNVRRRIKMERKEEVTNGESAMKAAGVVVVLAVLAKAFGLI